MALSPQTKRLLLAIVAWPAGIIGTVVLTFAWSLLTTPSCGEGPCAQELKPMSLTTMGLFLAMAFGPGIYATREWWRHRGRGPGEEQ
jgi:hypothetical protein